MNFKSLNQRRAKKHIIIIFLLCMHVIHSQVSHKNDEARIKIVKSKIELLETEIPGLSEKVNINISNATLPNFLRAISKFHKININVANDLNGITIANGLNDVTVGDLLLFLVKEYQLDIDVTGNILSVKKYVKPITKPKEKEIKVTYDVMTKAITLDLANDPVHKVFRKIIDLTGRNLLFTPALKEKPLSLYVTNVSVDTALEKLAETNGLDVHVTADGFYTFEDVSGANQNLRSLSGKKKRRSTLGYEVIDTIQKVISVNLKETPVANLITDLGEDLHLNIFTASPLENAGKVTVKADKIGFDELLIKIFESNNSSASTVVNSNSRNNSNTRSNRNNSSQQNTVAANTITSNFTFKKEGNVYYFGTEGQLSLKTIESVQMLHRSIAMLGDANLGGGNFGGGNFVSGGTNFVGNQQTNSGLQQGGNNRNTSNNRSFGSNSSSFSRNTSFNNRGGTNRTTDAGSILELFPIAIVEGLDIKIDIELNSFIISGPSTKVEKFKKFVRYIDRPVPLVLIEVMILEVNRTATVDAGIEFGLGTEARTTSGVTFPNANITLGAETINRIIGGFDGFGSLNLGNVLPNFYMDIKAMETNGNVKILSTPKLSTLSGHKAYLSSGQTTYYAVTSQNIIGSQNPQTSEITNYQPIDAELALEFKPFVAGDGQITLDIQVIQSNFSGVRIAENAPPDINSRRFSSIMRMQANDIAILGGIEEKIKNDSGSGVPLLSRIPVLKWLFSKRKREDTKRKLNVIIKPTVFY